MFTWLLCCESLVAALDGLSMILQFVDCGINWLSQSIRWCCISLPIFWEVLTYCKPFYRDRDWISFKSTRSWKTCKFYVTKSSKSWREQVITSVPNTDFLALSPDQQELGLTIGLYLKRLAWMCLCWILSELFEIVKLKRLR